MFKVILCASLLALSCTPAQRQDIPVLSTIDAVGMGLAKVMRWCDEAGADASTVQRAQAAIRDKNYRDAVALLAEAATELRQSGRDVPDDAFVTLKLIEGALAAQAIQDGMRALSAPEE